MFKKEMDTIYRKLKENLPDVWDGRKSIIHMKENGCRHWRQMEWPGFYFQHMCETILGKDGYMKIPGPRYGNVTFDGFRIIPWDFKVHSVDSARDDDGKIPTNGYHESLCAIEEYGSVGFIILMGECDYDDDRQSFKKWHDQLKGGISKYEKERIGRAAPSRRRKINFAPKELIFVLVDKENVNSCGTFQANFRNSNGVARNAKILLDLKKNDQLNVVRYNFQINLDL